ncbi:MAG: endo-1,4-beta-xylanase [bacterium]|nr:endo-1,4-beta-xylanase [bacterium]
MQKQTFQTRRFSIFRFGLFRTTVAGTLFFLALALLNGLVENKPKTGNLLIGQNWQQFAGVTSTKEGLFVEPLNRIIGHEDGSLGQPNPPVNFLGPHLSVSGDFVVTARMEKINSGGTLRLYGKPPVIYDKWRFESASISIEVATSSIVLRIWDGSSSSSMDMRIYPFILKEVTDISIEHEKSLLIVSANKQVLGAIPDHHIFDSHEVWFGADTLDGDGFLLSAFSAKPLKNGHLEIIAPPSFEVKHDKPNALRNLGAMNSRKLKIGVAVAFSALVTDEDYRKLVLNEFSMITPENGLKPQFIHPQKDIYSFTEMDALVNIALKNDILVHGHTLVYAKSNPKWMSKTPKEEREDIMIDHIKVVTAHFKGKVAEWDVINEPFSNKQVPYRNLQQGLENNIWYEAMGEKYIDLAFQTAHKTDPSAVLYLNDYGLERDGERWDALIGLIKRLKNRGVPIQGVGFESHVYGDGDYLNASILRAHMRTLAELGLKVRISEIDVTGDDPKEQVNQYLIALDVCLQVSNCTGYSTWGVTDLYGSTTRSDRYPQVFGTSLLFDENLKAKPAYSALQERLRKLY